MLHSNAAGNSLPIEFKSPDGQILTTKLIDGNPWWIGKEVCRILGIKNHNHALISTLDDDEKGVAINDTLGGKQEMIWINESGLYHLIFASRKEEAKRFRKWVTSVVLPQIRKTGSYTSSRKKYVETDEEKTLFILIAMHLRVGDIKNLAQENNWSRHRVSRVKRGITVDVDILKALAARAAHNMHNPLRKYGAVAANQLDLFTTHTQLS